MTKKFIEGRIDSVSRIIVAAPSTLFQAFMSPDAFMNGCLLKKWPENLIILNRKWAEATG